MTSHLILSSYYRSHVPPNARGVGDKIARCSMDMVGEECEVKMVGEEWEVVRGVGVGCSVTRSGDIWW